MTQKMNAEARRRAARAALQPAHYVKVKRGRGQRRNKRLAHPLPHTGTCDCGHRSALSCPKRSWSLSLAS